MLKLKNRAGIYITSSKLYFVEFLFHNEEYVLNYLDEAYYEDEINFATDKEAKILLYLQAAYNEISAKTQINTHQLSVSLPPESFAIVRLPYDNTLLKQDLQTQFAWEFSQLYPHKTAIDYSLEFYEVEDESFAERNYAIVAGLNRKMLRIINAFSTKNGFELQSIDYAHFSCDNALLLNYPAVAEGMYLSLLIDNGTLSFELLVNGKPVFVKTKKMKSESEINRAIKDEMDNLSKYNIDVAQISSAFLFADRLTPSFVSSVERQTGLKIFPVNPFKRFTIHSKLSTSKILKEHFYSFAPAAGACYRIV